MSTPTPLSPAFNSLIVDTYADYLTDAKYDTYADYLTDAIHELDTYPTPPLEYLRNVGLDTLEQAFDFIEGVSEYMGEVSSLRQVADYHFRDALYKELSTLEVYLRGLD